jgi:hypothetical protein
MNFMDFVSTYGYPAALCVVVFGGLLFVLEFLARVIDHASDLKYRRGRCDDRD